MLCSWSFWYLTKDGDLIQCFITICSNNYLTALITIACKSKFYKTCSKFYSRINNLSKVGCKSTTTAGMCMLRDQWFRARIKHQNTGSFFVLRYTNWASRLGAHCTLHAALMRVTAMRVQTLHTRNFLNDKCQNLSFSRSKSEYDQHWLCDVWNLLYLS